MIDLALILACAPAVAPATVQRVIHVESKGDPLAIGVNGGKLQRKPRDAADAAALARAAIGQGYSVDLGLMQVNSGNLRGLGYSVEDMFEPCKNLAAGAKVLTNFYVSARARYPDDQSALKAALSAYNTGSYSRGFSNGYVAKYVTPASYGGDRRLPMLNYVAQVVRQDLRGRITDVVRPLDAGYGAANSYHKYGQAIDFVPATGLHSITRDQIRWVMAQRGIRLVELLGPGDPGHSDHWHIAFAVNMASADSPQRPQEQAASFTAPAPAKPTPYNINSIVFVKGQETQMQNTEVTMPVISQSEEDAFVPGVQVEHTAESAERNGAFEETAMSEADAWEANTDIHATAIVVGGKPVAKIKE